MVRLARRKAERRLAVFGCIRSADLPVKSMFFQKRIVFFLFQPVWRPGALLVPGRHVARGWFTQRFGLGAFKRNDFLRHILVIPSPPPAPAALPRFRALLLPRLTRKVR